MSNTRVEDRNVLNKKKRIAREGQLYTKILDMLGYSGYFGMCINYLILAFEKTTALLFLWFSVAIALPASAILGIIETGFSLREAQLKKWRTHPTIRFAVNALSALVLLGTVAALFISAATLPIVIIPAGVVASLAIKATYHAVASLYYVAKAIATPDQKGKYLEKAAQSFLAATANTLIAAATALTFMGTFAIGSIGGGLLVGSLAIAAGMIGTGVAISKLVNLYRKNKTTIVVEKEVSTSTANSTSTYIRTLSNGAKLENSSKVVNDVKNVEVSHKEPETAPMPTSYQSKDNDQAPRMKVG